ncbi:metalloendoproteinase 1-like [Cucurbita pepo subsp. pepo]|uniref:metalloendoproteinase 1-like n=1 Tax=Cucurbita pepo subsp. pepo TaxID=3664 RepID=UPI000C9D47A6|nr:metalloendoproteinase 1-like [Cucurbita pepo subsp. pepo]
MDLKSCLQVMFILVAAIAPHAIMARHLHTHKLSSSIFPQHLVGSGKGHNIEGIHNVRAFLQRYGYLSTNVDTKGNAFDDNLEFALKSYQKFFNLNVSGILDAETLELMSQPRCGVPDVFINETGGDGNGDRDHPIGLHYRFFNDSKPKWSASKYNLKYTFVRSFPEQYKSTVVQAMISWSLNSVFAFSEGSTDDTDVRISFEVGEHGDGHPFKKGSGVLAHAFAPEDGRLHFNEWHAWADGAYPDKYDVGSVALHELGHILGLGHSDIRDAVMWPSMRPNTKKELSSDDVSGISALYDGFQED